MKQMNELVEQAKFVADWHGSDWSSALCQDKDGKQAHEIICESRGEAVISTGSNSNEASWLCDYLELCSPANILAIAEAFRVLEQRAEAAEEKLAELAELEKQEPYGYVVVTGTGNKKFSTRHPRLRVTNEAPVPVYTRPAPAVSMAELVPVEDLRRIFDFAKFVIKCYRNNGEYAPLSSQEPNEIAAILRNIEEAK